MFPSTGTIFVCPFTDEALYNEQYNKSAFWQTTDFYGVDLSCMYDQSMEEYFGQAVVGYFPSSCLLSSVSAHECCFVLLWMLSLPVCVYL